MPARSKRDELAERITDRVRDFEAEVRAAVQLVCDSILIGKIGGYVRPDGWIDWPALTLDLIEGLPWSSGELRLARLACSLSGRVVFVDEDERITDIVPWMLSELLSGLDDTNRAAALDAVHFAATGRPMMRNPLDTLGGGS